jgi:hypothetical protein
MRLGLVGRGAQAQRYLMPKNGGAHIVSQVPGRIGPAEYQDWLQGVDGVIIATHPRGHRHLALDAIAESKHVLIEKPLALNLEDCEAIIDAAEAAGVKLQVAHLDLWTWGEKPWPEEVQAVARISYREAWVRDYPVWLDWGPHAVAILARLMPRASSIELYRRVQMEQSIATLLEVTGKGGFRYVRPRRDWPAPMWVALLDFMRDASLPCDYNFNRRVYRALFAQENHATR